MHSLYSMDLSPRCAFTGIVKIGSALIITAGFLCEESDSIWSLLREVQACFLFVGLDPFIDLECYQAERQISVA
jgi:hypothetical protein